MTEPLTFSLLHDQTNRGPIVKSDEAAILRERLAEATHRPEGKTYSLPTHVRMPISLFERLIHTAEK
jgi:hypothetical protein